MHILGKPFKIYQTNGTVRRDAALEYSELVCWVVLPLLYHLLQDALQELAQLGYSSNNGLQQRKIRRRSGRS